jgi:2-succinyl-5-enolpyruvyl-6-hydroxy-3-cyclohexene-1-carboxylate synthase
MSNPAQVFSSHLLAALSELEMEEVFLSPGSRSQSLVIAAAQLHDAGRITARIRIDERSMAFTALGAARISGLPVGLITTSGTAVANLHPAVLEAHHSGVPLIVLTADRPQELRGLGANQTTNQVGIFGEAARLSLDIEAPVTPVDTKVVRELAEKVVAVATGANNQRPGPVHVNICFKEPLSALEPNAGDVYTGAELDEDRPAALSFGMLDGTKNTVLIAGAEAGIDALETAEAFGWPIFAEPNSRCRTGANAIIGYSAILRDDKELSSKIERVVVYGKPTLSREVQKLIADKEIELVVVSSKLMGPFNPYGNAIKQVDEISIEGEVSSEWLARWRVAAHNWLSAQVYEAGLTRRKIIELVYEATQFDDSIVIGASRMIREADLWAPAKSVQVFSNRGLSGIDGTIATATGIALGSDGAITRVILGDLTLIHDASSMIEDIEESINLQLIMVNDSGGSIFENLEIFEVAEQGIFDRYFRAGQSVDYWSLANAYGFVYIAANNEQELIDALSASGRVLIEVKTN